ncbi:MAG TPA: ferritin-like domain-containing protein [Solirubrobacteraceae bacterium]|nr:ferritin-like domain-containing protein [Solirubrobacteraceae bacterium]
MPAPELSWITYELEAREDLPLLAAEAPAVVHLPDLRPFATPVDKARVLLESAAEVEHALLVQYLYAAYSLRTPDEVDPARQPALDESLDASWPRVLMEIAREEMGHLVTAQNLLLLLGLPPNLEREDFPPRKDLYPFALHLEALSQRSLAKYVVAESPADATGIDDIVALARESAGDVVNRVGVLYGLLGLVFSSGPDGAGSGDAAWDAMVGQLAAAAYQQSAPETWHLPDGALHPDSAERQGAPEDWEVGGLRVHRVADRAAAIQALRDVGEQGEGPTGGGETSHYERFLGVFRGVPGMPAFPAEGDWVATRGVPTDPRVDRIADERTRRWARLADVRYALLLGFVEDYLLSTGGERQLLTGWIFAEMRSRLGYLARQLTTMPHGDGGVAAVPFTLPDQLHLPPDAAARQAVHAARTRAAIALVEQLQAADAPDRDDPFLAQVLLGDRARLAYLEAPQPATSFARDIRPLFRMKDIDHMREMVDLDLSDLPAVRTAAADVLRRVKSTGRPMPPRPDAHWTAGQIALLERWIADGCPE